MGSKSKIMDFVIDGINEVYAGGTICDLFSGSASLAGAIGQQYPVHSNDIQNYSKILADTYNKAYVYEDMPSATKIIQSAKRFVLKNQKNIRINVEYDSNMSLADFQKVEDIQKQLIENDFDYKWHIFAKNYSGTWWSFEQCLWIDAIRQVAEKYRSTPCYPVILSSLMFAMAYSSQGTGHYAQYRDAKTNSSMQDILLYRKRNILDYFVRKYDEVISFIPKSKITMPHQSTALDYKDCLEKFDGGTVYADPPYCFVHYSRFYHTLETLILYDHPPLQIQREKVVKGRYRENRHQSPFCIKTKVKGAFQDMFEGIKNTRSNLVLSYSNTGMITIEELSDIATSIFGNRRIEILTTNHQHMTLGRREDRLREVQECLFLVY